MQKLSDNFWLRNFERSQTATKYGIENKMNTDEIINARTLCEKLLEKIRSRILNNTPLIITSGFRSKKLNDKVGWSSKSQHRYGKAVDFYSPHWTTSELFKEIKSDREIDYDQMIDETNFGDIIHISYDPDKEEQRRENLVARMIDGERVYDRVM